MTESTICLLCQVHPIQVPDEISTGSVTDGQTDGQIKTYMPLILNSWVH